MKSLVTAIVVLFSAVATFGQAAANSLASIWSRPAKAATGIQTAINPWKCPRTSSRIAPM